MLRQADLGIECSPAGTHMNAPLSLSFGPAHFGKWHKTPCFDKYMFPQFVHLYFFADFLWN
jgi:hypothetical protein